METWLQKARAYPPDRDGRDLLSELDAQLGGRELAPEEAQRVAEVLARKYSVPLVERARDLAKIALRSGLPDAGALYARCEDRFATLHQPRQKYGTVRWEMDGQVVLAPVDGTVSDEERIALGLPPISQLQEEVLAENLRRAAANYAQPLPTGAMIRRVWREVTPAELLERWQREGSPAWMDGDIFTLVYRGEADEVCVGGGIQFPLWRVKETDPWVMMARVADPDRMVIGYHMFPMRAGRPLLMDQIQSGGWRGPNAPPAPDRARVLAGSLTCHSLNSSYLGEDRTVSVYLPPGHNPSCPTPVIYCADGQALVGFVEVIDPLVVAGKLPPVLLVGVHCGKTQGEDRRAEEYLPGLNPGRFESHRLFFVEEVVAWAEAELGAALSREHRAVLRTYDCGPSGRGRGGVRSPGARGRP